MALRGVWGLRGVWDSITNGGSNTRPTASITSPNTGVVGERLTLVGSVFDPNTDDLVYYRWRVVSGFSRGFLTSTNGKETQLVLRERGRVSIGLVASDGHLDSEEVIQDIDIQEASNFISNSDLFIEGIPDGQYSALFSHLDSGTLIQKKLVSFNNGICVTQLPVKVGTRFDVSIKNNPITNYTGLEGVTT